MGQILPTVPANVFRLTVDNYTISGEQNIKNQYFEMRGIGRSYFDEISISEDGIFNSTNDLYHMGSMLINDSISIESYLKTFNSTYGTSLPVFEAGYYNTSRLAAPIGSFSELKKRKEKGRNWRIDYGLNDEIMLSAIIPNIKSLKEKYSVSTSIDRLYGVNQLLDYHTNAMAVLDSFFQTSTFLLLPNGKKDSLQLIYNDFYSSNGDHSTLWALYAKDDPFSNGFIHPQFMTPNHTFGDTVDFDSLKSYYIPESRLGSGVNDITFGITTLLKGNPSWLNKKGAVLYGRLFFSIPFGFMIESFKKVRSKQLTQLNLGSGAGKISIGLLGGYNWQNKSKSRFYGSADISFSSPAILNTPINLFSGSHTNPDSIVAKVGETYKLKKGRFFKSKVGYEFALKKERILIRFESSTIFKSRDNYISLDGDWDKWMEKHDGYDSSHSLWDICSEIWLLNSKSKDRIGPVSFDAKIGIRQVLNNKYSYDGNTLYIGFTTYLQGW